MRKLSEPRFTTLTPTYTTETQPRPKFQRSHQLSGRSQCLIECVLQHGRSEDLVPTEASAPQVSPNRTTEAIAVDCWRGLYDCVERVRAEMKITYCVGACEQPDADNLSGSFRQICKEAKSAPTDTGGSAAPIFPRPIWLYWLNVYPTITPLGLPASCLSGSAPPPLSLSLWEILFFRFFSRCGGWQLPFQKNRNEKLDLWDGDIVYPWTTPEFFANNARPDTTPTLSHSTHTNASNYAIFQRAALSVLPNSSATQILHQRQSPAPHPTPSKTHRSSAPVPAAPGGLFLRSGCRPAHFLRSCYLTTELKVSREGGVRLRSGPRYAPCARG